jgi:hypothetical protein
MAFRLSSFLGGVAKGATDLIEEREKENTLQIKDSIKNMYHNYAEYRKETEKKKEEIRETVGSLRSFKFADGALDEKELIALASDLPTAKSIAEEFRKNPEKLEGLSKSFIKGTGNIPDGMTFNDYVNQYGKVAKMDAAEFEQAASGKQDGFLNKMVYGNNVTKIRNAAAKYGVSAEELYNVGAAKGSKSFPALLEVDYAKLKDKPDFKKIESDAQIAMYRAKQEGTEEQQAKAAENLGLITFVKEFGDKKDKTQNIIEADYANKVIKLEKEGKLKEAAEMEAELKRWKKLVANPPTPAKTDADKISQANLIVTASKAMEATFKSYLPQGAFTTKENLDGTVSLQVASFVKPEQEALALTAGRSVLIKEMTTNGKPKSEMHKNALISSGVQFDQDGNAVNPKVQYGSGGGTPSPAPAPGSPRLGPRPASAPAAPAPSPAPALAPEARIPVFDRATNTWK